MIQATKMQETGNNQSQTYNLSIRLHADGFSFYSYNPTRTEPVAIEDYIYHEEESVAETLKKAIAQSAIVRKRNNPVVYGLVTGLSMQVPLECFRKEEAHALYRLTYAQEKTGKTYYNILPHLEIAQIFTVDHEVERILNQHFPGIRFYHSHTMILEKLWLLAQQDKRQLYAYFDEKEVFVFGYRAQQLCYANTFPADVADNAVYFILSVWKDLKMDVRQEECILLGNGNIKDDTAQLLARYLQNVRNTNAADIYRRSTLARNQQLPFDLLALWVHVI